MLTHKLLVPALLGFLAAAFISGRTGAVEDTAAREEFSKILARLDNDKYEVRTQAKADLAAWVLGQGPAAQGDLEGALKTATAEAGRVLRAELAHVEKLEEYDQLFAWYDTLGFPDVARCKYVRAPCGMISSTNGKNEIMYAYGFLLSEDGQNFTILTGSLDRLTRPLHPPAGGISANWTYEPWDIARQAGAELENKRERLLETATLFTLARQCAQHGLKRLAYQLCERVEQNERARFPVKTMREALAVQFSALQLSHLLMEIRDSKVTRKELLEHFQAYLEHFPETVPEPTDGVRIVRPQPIKAQVNELVAGLKEMVADDEAHAKTVKPWAQMDQHERIAELIFQLRDQNGHEIMNGMAHLLEDPRGKDSPAEKLIAIGYEAVPQVIACLDDKRITRTIDSGEQMRDLDHYQIPYIHTVGEAAKLVINRIAAHNFDSPVAIKAWWAEFQQKGEKTALIDAVSAGGPDCPTSARRLVEKYPADALAALQAGVAHAGEDHVRADLLSITGKLDGAEALAFLLKEMKDAPDLPSRLAAAAGVFHRGREEGIAAVSLEWRKLAIPRTPEDAADKAIWHAERLIEFMTTRDRPAAIEALRENLRRRPVQIRFEVLEKTNSAATRDERRQKALSPETMRAMEHLLIDELTDTDTMTGNYGNWDGKSFDNPHLCDFAAHVLANRWDGKYRFDIMQKASRRARSRIEIANIWSKEHNEELLPVTPEAPIVLLPEDKVRQVLSHLTRAPGEMQRTGLATSMETMGLPALPHVVKLLEGLKADDPARPAVARLASRLGAVVNEAAWMESAVKPDKECEKLVLEFKDRPLTPDAWITGLRRLVAALPAGAGGVELIAERDADLPGISLSARLVSAPEKPDKTHWYIAEHVTTKGVRFVTNKFCDEEEEFKKQDFAELRQALEAALAAPPGERLYVYTVLQQYER